MIIIIDTQKATKHLNELGKLLSSKQLALATSRAINRTMLQGRTVARRKVSDKYNIPQRSLTAVDVIKATASRLHGELKADYSTLPLSAFTPKFDTSTRSIRLTRRGELKVKDRTRKKSNPGKGVSFEVEKGKRATIPFAFMAPNKKDVFARGAFNNSKFVLRLKRQQAKGNDLPIQALNTVSIYTAVTNPYALQAIKMKVEDAFPKELERDLRYRIGRLKPHSGPST